MGDRHRALLPQDLRVTVKKTDKLLLKDLTGLITSGFYAVMVRIVAHFPLGRAVRCARAQHTHSSALVVPPLQGPSGSGKTTLLNTLAYRLDSAVKARPGPASERFLPAPRQLPAVALFLDSLSPAPRRSAATFA